MKTNEQKAAEGVEEVLHLKAEYIGAKDKLKASRLEDESLEKQRKLLANVHRAATAVFNSVDKCISQSDLLGANRSEFWAVDLAATAINTLDHITRCYEYLWQEADRLGFKRPKPAPTAFFAMQNSARIYFPGQARSLRIEFEKRGLPTIGFDTSVDVNTRYKIWEKWAMTITVVVFVLIMLAIGIWVKDLNNFNIFLFRTVLALIGGAFGGIFIPGLLRVQAQITKFAVTAAGAAAFFAIIFFANPPALVKQTVETSHSSSSPSPTP